MPEEPILLGSNREGTYIPPYGPVSRSRSSMRARGPESTDEFQNLDSCHGPSSGLGHVSNPGPGSLQLPAESAVGESTIGIVMEDNTKRNFVRSRSNSIERREEGLKRNQSSEMLNRGGNTDLGVINTAHSRSTVSGGEWMAGKESRSPRVSTGVLSSRTSDNVAVDEEKGVITVRRLNSLVASIVRNAGTEMKKKNQLERKEINDRERAKKYLADEKDENDRFSNRNIPLEVDPDRSSHNMGESRKETSSSKKNGGRERAVSGAIPHDDKEDVYATPCQNNLLNHVVLIAGIGPNPANWAPANSLILPIIFFIKAIRAHSGDKIIVLCERAQELIPLIGD